ncbi:hypothetical protein FB451DRAFT_1407430 [Mycena latifolia]|nr:hypothetical protein FB451DRAFT_1407430 [Mycena latifolia]
MWLDAQRTVSRVFQSPPAAYLIDYDTIIAGALVTGLVNFTAAGDNNALVSPGDPDTFTRTIAYLPFAASNEDDGALINAAGSTCTFYNATHAARTHFVNGTQTSSVSVTEFHAPRGTRAHLQRRGRREWWARGGPRGGFAPGLGGPLHFFALADAMTARLLGAIIRDVQGAIGPLDPTGDVSLALETSLFESPDGFNASAPRFTGLNSSFASMSQGLENLVANMSLSFVHMGTGFTPVDALVPSPGIINTSNRRTLGATYLPAFACRLGTSALGRFCLVRNGAPSSNSCSSRIDPVADSVEAGEPRAEAIRLMFGGVAVPGRGTRAAFGLVSEQKVEVLRRRR